MRISQNQRRVVPIVVGLVMVTLVSALGYSGVFHRFELLAWDVCTRVMLGSKQPDSRIMLVAVDPSSMDYFADNGVLWPWPRDMWAQAIEVAESAGAAGIIFDVMFDDPGIERTNSPARYTDQMFADKLADPFPSVICAFLTPGDEPVQEAPAGLEYREKTIPPVEMQGYSLLLPHENFRGANLGLSNTLPDKDGVIRSAALVYESNSIKLPTLALRAVEMMNEGRTVPIRLDNQKRLWLRYYDKGGPGGAFPYISAASLITGAVPRDSLKGKILVVGGFSIGLLDFKPTPVADVEHVYPGFEIHATLISNLLQNDGLVPASRLAIFIMTFLIGVVGLAVFRIHGSVWFQASYVVLITVAVLCIMYVGFRMNTLLPVTSPLLACYFGIGVRFYSGWRIEGRQLSVLQKLFSRYLDDKVINKMLDDPEKLQNEYIKRNATILMTDMVSFTTVSEGLLPEELFSVVNEYHEATVNQIFMNQGMLDKYIGDSVMAIFGAPMKDDQSKINAAKALIGIHEAVDELSEKRLAAGKITIDIRVGIHTDEVVVGNIGHPRRVDYTAIGSGVNTASRLESATRILNCRNLVSESFCWDLPDTIYRRELGTLILKGQSEALTVFELITNADNGAWINDWAEAWRLWRDGKRHEAFLVWEDIQSARKDDATLIVMLKWLKEFVSHNGENDHVWTLTTK